jgi:metal-responsive CopG/Arc/MetJ family transcriptional regulator
MSEETSTIALRIELDALAKLDQMVKADDSDRSKFIRKLIRKEFEWRATRGIISMGELPGPADADRPMLVTVKQ